MAIDYNALYGGFGNASQIQAAQTQYNNSGSTQFGGKTYTAPAATPKPKPTAAQKAAVDQFKTERDVDGDGVAGTASDHLANIAHIYDSNTAVFDSKTKELVEGPNFSDNETVKDYFTGGTGVQVASTAADLEKISASKTAHAESGAADPDKHFAVDPGPRLVGVIEGDVQGTDQYLASDVGGYLGNLDGAAAPGSARAALDQVAALRDQGYDIDRPSLENPYITQGTAVVNDKNSQYQKDLALYGNFSEDANKNYDVLDNHAQLAARSGGFAISEDQRRQIAGLDGNGFAQQGHFTAGTGGSREPSGPVGGGLQPSYNGPITAVTRQIGDAGGSGGYGGSAPRSEHPSYTYTGSNGQGYQQPTRSTYDATKPSAEQTVKIDDGGVQITIPHTTPTTATGADRILDPAPAVGTTESSNPTHYKAPVPSTAEPIPVPPPATAASASGTTAPSGSGPTSPAPATSTVDGADAAARVLGDSDGDKPAVTPAFNRDEGELPEITPPLTTSGSKSPVAIDGSGYKNPAKENAVIVEQAGVTTHTPKARLDAHHASAAGGHNTGTDTGTTPVRTPDVLGAQAGVNPHFANRAAPSGRGIGMDISGLQN